MRRGYRLLCPIARALDHVGDRWTLLILRDLHAGPMRFGELLSGLPGLASNLLTTRLDKLVAAGLVAHDGPLYALTDAGRATDGVLWELARLGMAFEPDPELKRPGHLRLAAVTLQNAMRRVLDEGASVHAQLELDGEPFTISTRQGSTKQGPLTVRYGAAEDPQVIARSSYEPMMAAAAGEIPLDAFRAEHVTLEGDDEAVAAFRDVMTRVMTEGFGASLS